MKSRTPLDAQQDVVKLTSVFHARVLANLTSVSVEVMTYWVAHPDELGRALGSLRRIKQMAGDWLERILASENAAQQAFFGETFNLFLFRQTLEHHGEDQIREWMKLGMEPHFLPDVVFAPESNFPGWKVRPNDWYWQQLAAGKLKRRNVDDELVTVKDARLEGAVVLFDTRLKPPYREGKQMFANDKNFMGRIISQLREDGLIKRCACGPQSSRFEVSADEWQNQIRPRVAEKLRIEPNQVRLELALEANVFPQLYKMPRTKDGTTDTWIWYEEYFEGLASRLSGGDSGDGGLSSVCYVDSGCRWDFGAVRPLGVLATLPSDA